MAVAKRTEARDVDKIPWREDLYPRFEPSPEVVQRYADAIDQLPPIEINQRDELIDGYHRWTAHRKVGAHEIRVIVTETTSDTELLELAIQRNAAHGLQLSLSDKRRLALRLYNGGNKDYLARLLSVSRRTIQSWVADKDRAIREEQNHRIADQWMACDTQEEIAEAVGLSKGEVNERVRDCSDLEKLPNLNRHLALFEEPDWQPPLYDIWSFGKLENATRHFGNSHVGIVENLLYLYTAPFDIVIDPFAGGGSTIDICKKRSRRYWASDRKPPVERPDIRTHDVVTNGLSGPPRWSDVALVYLDPPYWRQAEGQYSKDPTDLANMPLERFTETLVGVVGRYGEKLKPGAHIACLIQPTQWKNEGRQVTFHDLDLVRAVEGKLELVHRFVCPYPTQQYNAQQVAVAKREKLVLILSRMLLVWRRSSKR